MCRKNCHPYILSKSSLNTMHNLTTETGSLNKLKKQTVTEVYHNLYKNLMTEVMYRSVHENRLIFYFFTCFY